MPPLQCESVRRRILNQAPSVIDIFSRQDGTLHQVFQAETGQDTPEIWRMSFQIEHIKDV